MSEATDIFKIMVKQNARKLLLLAILTLCILAIYGYEIYQEHSKTKMDMEKTGSYDPMISRDGQVQCFSIYVNDTDGLDKVAIKDEEGTMVWLTSLEGSVTSSFPSGRVLTVSPSPPLPGGTYTLTVWDRKGNSFEKEVGFEWKSKSGNLLSISKDEVGNAEIEMNLTNRPDWDLQPCWSPDGTKIAFCSFADGNYEIYVMNADGSDQRNLTNHQADDWKPHWSADGGTIVFESMRNETKFGPYIKWDKFKMNPDGTDPQVVTGEPINEWNELWSPEKMRLSPDGSQKLFESGEASKRDIHLIDSTGSNAIQLTNDPTDEVNPTWSPDGQEIGFIRRPGCGRNDIHVMNADGTGERLLVRRTNPDSYLAWSPDGTKIAYSAIRNHRSDIYVVDVEAVQP